LGGGKDRKGGEREGERGRGTDRKGEREGDKQGGGKDRKGTEGGGGKVERGEEGGTDKGRQTGSGASFAVRWRWGAVSVRGHSLSAGTHWVVLVGGGLLRLRVGVALGVVLLSH
jgi:hypothetical protein